MKRFGWGCVALVAFLFHGNFIKAQSSLDVLEEELKEAKQQHQQVTSETLSNFFSQLDAAMASPEAAVALYQLAGGTLPPPTPVVTEHEDETASEKEARLALDQANLTSFGAVLQIHCGLMHYAAMFVLTPDKQGLQEEWVAWLQKVAPLYPQIAGPANIEQPAPRKKKDHERDHDSGPPVLQRPPPFDLSDLKGKSMHDSIISKFLNFKSWGDKEQGGWSIRDLPSLYQSNVLAPLRTSPTTATLAAWDVYIAMANSDEKDSDRWNQVVYPPLQFERAVDDYAVAPSTEKLEALVNLIKANPTYPKADDWIHRVHDLMEAYRARTTGSTTASAPTPPGGSSEATNPNVTTSTVTEGDMTIITTHTNSAPVVNAPPAH